MALRLAGERYSSEGIFDTVTITDGAGHYLQVPKLTTAQRDALSPVNGMIIYNTTTGQFEGYDNGWGGFGGGVSDHGALTGLGDDDHTQYVLHTEVDAEAVSAVEAAGLALASGKNIKLIQAVTSDHTWSGITAVMTAGAALTIGQAVYVGGADSKMELADADAAATMPVIALATGTIAEDATGEFLLFGFFRDDTWTWTPGGLLYASTTPGALTQTAPSGTGDQVQVLGVAITADIILFNPSLELVEIT